MTNTNELTRRIERIESQLRFWRMLGLACTCILVTVACMGAAFVNEIPDVIKAKEFQLIGANGHVSGKLETMGSGAFLRLNESTEFFFGFDSGEQPTCRNLPCQ